MTSHRAECGFTLIELLIVVAIIGILAAIAVPNFLNAQTRARLAATYASLKAIQTGIAAYEVDHNRTPVDKGPDAETGETYHALTTPIPYLSGIDVFEDEFKTRSDEDLGIYYAYGGPNHVSMGSPERTAMFSRGNVSYFIFGWGPDRQPDWPWPRLAETLAHLHRGNGVPADGDAGIFYAATNGLVSRGDIIATQARIFQ